MRVAQEKVRQFHERYGYSVAEKPQLIDPEQVQFRFDLIEEELHEYMAAACADQDIVKVADAIGDILYVVLGTAVSHGIDVQPIFDEIHRSNMSKSPATPERPGKPVKGPDYFQPRLAPLLLMQATGLDGDA